MMSNSVTEFEIDLSTAKDAETRTKDKVKSDRSRPLTLDSIICITGETGQFIIGIIVIPRRILTWLVSIALVLPISIAVILGVARLLGAMHDVTGATALDRIALAGGIMWGVDLACLLVAQGINSVGPPGEGGE
jgi:hypothetical protein